MEEVAEEAVDMTAAADAAASCGLAVKASHFDHLVGCPSTAEMFDVATALVVVESRCQGEQASIDSVANFEEGGNEVS